MIHFYLTSRDQDFTQPAGRIHWGSIKDGEIVADHTDEIEDVTQPFADDHFSQPYECFDALIDAFQDKVFEGLCDPIAVLRKFKHAPIVAAVPSKNAEELFWDGDYDMITTRGNLANVEQTEVSCYEPNSHGLRLRDGNDVVKNHDYPDRYRTVEIGTLDSAQPMGNEEDVETNDPDRSTAYTVHGVWDTNNGRVVENISGEFNSVITEMVNNRYPLRDSIELARLSKPTRRITIVDDKSGERVTPEEVLNSSEAVGQKSS